VNTETKECLTGHPAKLKDGAWGAHVDSDRVQPGDVVHLTTKGGKEWDSTVEKVVWKGVDSDGQSCALCTLMTRDKPASLASAAASGEGEGENDL
jgi:hypothetical protein